MYKRLAVIILPLLFLGNNALAYSEKTTHPALTNEILNFAGGFSAEERAWIVSGSQLEDTPPRWVNHFYDPVNNTGWTGAKAGSVPAEVLTGMVSVGATAPVSAIDWVKGCNTQSAYQNNGGNRTWDKALDYYAQGNMKETYITLGHILHIVEDMGVPDHTRDDTHAQDLGGDTGSPFEQYTAKYDPETIKALKISEGLGRAGLSAPKMNSLEEYLVAMAKYSNKYFFSKDTINDLKYPEPKIVWNDGSFAYGKDENGNEFPLLAVSLAAEGSEKYFLKNAPSYFPILDAYFTRLSRQIVLNGAGIVELFKRKAPENKENSEYLVDDRHTMAKIACQTGDTLSLFTPMGIVSGIGNVLTSVLGQIVSTLKSGAGFVVGLIAPKNDSPAATAPPQEPDQNNDLPSVDTADDLSVETDAFPDTSHLAPANQNPTSTLQAPAPPIPAPSAISTTTATTTPLIAMTTLKIKVATTTATSSPIVYFGGGGGGGASAQNQSPLDDIAEESPNETATSTTSNSTSTQEVATTTDTLATSTEESATSTEATTTTFAPPAADHVLISEILFDADGSDSGKEFIELYNPANESKDLTGYRLRYVVENSTTTHSLVTVQSTTSSEQSIIPAHGFLLFGFGGYDPQNYEGKIADIVRSASLPNGEDADGNPQKINLGLYNETNAKIDVFSYDKISIPAPGYSLERMAWDGSACISAVDANEFSGNGCATNENYFESRQTPYPQNSSSLPEPREKPTTPMAPDGANIAVYDSMNSVINLAWVPSSDVLSSTSTIIYKLYDTSTSSPTLLLTTTAVTSSLGAQPGQIFKLGLVAEDKDGLSSATSSIDMEIATLAPAKPKNFAIVFDDVGIKLNLSWASSTDPDSLDAELTYEINVSTSTELASSSWTGVDNSLSTQVGVSTGNSYTLGVRAKDAQGNYSEANILNWSFPSNFNPNRLTATSSDGNFIFIPRASGSVGQITIMDDGGIYGACGNNQSRVLINGHSYSLTSKTSTSPKQYIYAIASSTESLSAGTPIIISWQGYFAYEPSITQTQDWFNFGRQEIINLMLTNYQKCQMPIATTTATLVGT